MKLVHLLMYSARWLLLTALLASAVNGLLASRIVSLMNRSLDASGDEQRALGVEFFLLSLFALSFRWFSLAQFVRASQSTLARLRLHISQRIIRASYRDIESRGPARLLAVLSEDVGTVGECFMVLPWLFVHGVVIVGCLGHLLVLSWQAFSFMCLLLVLGSLGYMDGARKAQTGLRQARLEEDALFEHFRSLFAGAKELKLHQGRREAFLDGALSVSAERVRAARTAGLLRHTALGNWRVFLLFVVVGAVLFVTGPALGLGDEVRSGYALTLLYLMVPANSVLEAAPSLGRMHVALERIDDLTSVPQAEDGMGSATLPAFQSISLSHVTHQYQREDEERSFTLGPVRLDLRAGEIVFLVGGNGSGKTTLAKLITGLYQPESGQVGYNGRPLTASEQDACRESFSAVFSDFHLFEQLVEPASTRGIADSRLDVSARGLASRREGPRYGRRIVDNLPLQRSAQASRPLDGMAGRPSDLRVR